MKRFLAGRALNAKKLILLLLAVLLLAGCAAPQQETGAEVMDINPLPDAANKEKVTATLYFGNSSSQYLVGETRTIEVPANERVEYTILEALIKGPDSQSGEFNQLINPNTDVVDIGETDDVLFVTLSKELLDWSSLPLASLSAEEQPARKQLAIYSIVNTLIEYTGCARVQLLLDDNNSGTGQRIEVSRAGFGAEGVLEPLERNGSLILTPSNTVGVLLDALTRKDYTDAYTYLAYNDVYGESKPDEAVFTSTLQELTLSIEGFTVRDTVVSADGQSATVMLDYTLRAKAGDQKNRTNVPVRLVRENDIWKQQYTEFQRLFIDVG